MKRFKYFIFFGIFSLTLGCGFKKNNSGLDKLSAEDYTGAIEDFNEAIESEANSIEEGIGEID
jgi:hypothetical protein